jgi:hypothetical protein
MGEVPGEMRAILRGEAMGILVIAQVEAPRVGSTRELIACGCMMSCDN